MSLSNKEAYFDVDSCDGDGVTRVWQSQQRGVGALESGNHT